MWQRCQSHSWKWAYRPNVICEIRSIIFNVHWRRLFRRMILIVQIDHLFFQIMNGQLKLLYLKYVGSSKYSGFPSNENFMAEWYRQHTVICTDQIRTQIYVREDFHNIFCGEYQKFIESKEHQISLLTHFTVIASILHDMPAVWPSNPVTWQQYQIEKKGGKSCPITAASSFVVHCHGVSRCVSNLIVIHGTFWSIWTLWSL